MIGTLLKDTYRVVQPLGEGGMGTLYVAEHKTLPKRYAVKVLKSAEKASPELLTRFEQEARIASGLGHPNIVEVLDFDRQPDGSPFIVMELLDGEDLAARLAKHGALEPAALLPLCRQLCAALAAAHEAGIVHRDLKPQNIFLHRWGDQELVKVLDFGISKMTGGQTDLTADSAVIGTAHYMAPEQARGAAADVDGRADLFSLGTIVFQCLTGKRAFDGESLPEIIHALCYGERPLLATHTPELAAALDPVLARLLAVEREERYDTAQEAWNALAPALGGEATTLPLGKSAPATEPGLDATVAAAPDPAMDATVASKAELTPVSATDATVASDAVPPPAHGIRRRTKVVLTTLLVALFGIPLLLWGGIAVRSCIAPQKKPADPKSAKTSTTGTPEKRPRPSKYVTLALLPGSCLGKATDIADSLRESRLKESKGLLLPPDKVDQALKELANVGGSRAGRERRVGQRLGATLLASVRCVGKQVKVRVVRVSDGAVVATKLVSQPLPAEQLRDLISIIRNERHKLVATLETQSPVATKAYQTYIELRRGGIHRGNQAQVIKSLNKTCQADPKWERPRLILAGLLASQYARSWKPELLLRIEQLVAPLGRPGGKYEGYAYLMRGVIAYFREDISLGLRHVTRAATLLPKEPDVHRLRSQIFLAQGEDQLAQQVMQRAAAADPGNILNAVRVASNFWITGEFEAALKAVKPYVASQNRQHRLGASDPDLRLGYPRSEGAHALRGIMLLFLGRIVPAGKAFRLELDHLASRSSFGNAQMEAYTYFGLAMVHHLNGKPKRGRQARKRAERALRKWVLSSGNPNLHINDVLWVIAPLAPSWIGPLLDRMERPKLPFYADMLVARASALARMGRKSEARKLLDKAVAIKPERRKGLRTMHRRFLKMCRKMDRHWKKQGRKPPLLR